MIAAEIFKFNLLKGVIFQYEKHGKKNLIKNLSEELGKVDSFNFKIPENSTSFEYIVQPGIKTKRIFLTLLKNNLLPINSTILEKVVSGKHYKTSFKTLNLKQNELPLDKILTILTHELSIQKSNKNILRVLHLTHFFIQIYQGKNLEKLTNQMIFLRNYLLRENHIINKNPIDFLNKLIQTTEEKHTILTTHSLVVSSLDKPKTESATKVIKI